MPVINRTASILTTELLDRFGERAPRYDRENRFFQEDFDELKAAGYLLLAVPKAFGGAGLNLAEVCREQARLAYSAPATALAVNMHLYWTGVAADLYRSGDHSLDWILKEAAAGEVFAAGHGERGNDLPVLASSSTAERVDGGYRFTGHKIFGSLTPVWTRLGIHAMDLSDPDQPDGRPRLPAARHRRLQDRRDVGHAGHARHAQRRHHPRGRGRARSLHRARRAVRLRRRGRIRPRHFRMGGADVRPHLPGCRAARARSRRGRTSARRRPSRSAAGRWRGTRWCSTRSPRWTSNSTRSTRIVVARGRGLVGWGGSRRPLAGQARGREIPRRRRRQARRRHRDGRVGRQRDVRANELERLYRDVRCGGFHPANSAVAHEIVGKTALGLLGEAARW